MTTIAWDGKTLAVDSQATTGDLISSYKTQKLFRNVGKYEAVAFCGELSQAADIIAYLKGVKCITKPTGEYNLIAISKGKAFRISSCSQLPMKLPNITTDGSGHEMAHAAMKVGASAIEAVKIACELDIYSGGKVQSYTVKEK